MRLPAVGWSWLCASSPRYIAGNKERHLVTPDAGHIDSQPTHDNDVDAASATATVHIAALFCFRVNGIAPYLIDTGDGRLSS